MNKRSFSLYMVLSAVTGAGVAAAMFAAADAWGGLEATMKVPRCQAVLEDGAQCGNPAEKDSNRCWRHRGAVKAVGDAIHDAGKGADEAWRSTKSWSTNAWRATKSWSTNAWREAKQAFREAREDFSGGMSRAFKKEKEVDGGRAERKPAR
ncbi:MAG: hypothetical protein J6T01_03325 [Kiritimatiellae bacterium]|nr:hypothetical protein [Kiritimatiellia bacterium]